MTKKLMVLLDTVLGSTARTVRATVLILAVAVAAGPLHAVELPAWPTPSAVVPPAGGTRPPATLSSTSMSGLAYTGLS
ncbi:hypothetical protein [Kutzneria buriramensis]|uniref:hypothetical protein n=1 Tax=Kutzneria buriramensis TaxID=1045776 RepID=UPI0011C1B41A|nr:hypothetical protein [Kutzneria buriramensis]